MRNARDGNIASRQLIEESENNLRSKQVSVVDNNSTNCAGNDDVEVKADAGASSSKHLDLEKGSKPPQANLKDLGEIVSATADCNEIHDKEEETFISGPALCVEFPGGFEFADVKLPNNGIYGPTLCAMLEAINEAKKELSGEQYKARYSSFDMVLHYLCHRGHPKHLNFLQGKGTVGQNLRF